MRLAQPPLSELGYGQTAHLLGYERQVLPTRAVLPLLLALVLSLAVTGHIRVLSRPDLAVGEA